MRKLRLDLDALVVDSFATHPQRHARGTVRGHDDMTINCILDTEHPGTPVCTQTCMCTAEASQHMVCDAQQTQPVDECHA